MAGENRHGVRKELCEDLEKVLQAAETAVRAIKAVGADDALLRSARDTAAKSVKDTLDRLATQAGWPDRHWGCVDIPGITDNGEKATVRLFAGGSYDKSEDMFDTAQEGLETILRNPGEVYGFVSRDDGTLRTRVKGSSIDEVLKSLKAIGEGVVLTGQPKWFGNVIYGHKRAMSYMVCKKTPYLRIAILGL